MPVFRHHRALPGVLSGANLSFRVRPTVGTAGCATGAQKLQKLRVPGAGLTRVKSVPRTCDRLATSPRVSGPRAERRRANEQGHTTVLGWGTAREGSIPGAALGHFHSGLLRPKQRWLSSSRLRMLFLRGRRGLPRAPRRCMRTQTCACPHSRHSPPPRERDRPQSAKSIPNACENAKA